MKATSIRLEPVHHEILNRIISAGNSAATRGGNRLTTTVVIKRLIETYGNKEAEKLEKISEKLAKTA